MNFIDSLTPWRLKLALIIGPMAIAAVYLFLFAADRYVSQSVITVRQANQERSSMPGLAMVLGGINPASREDTLYLQQYIHSMKMLKHLEAMLNLRAHYEAEKLDPLYRLYPGTSQEWFLKYYRNRVHVQFDDKTSLLHLSVEGFEPAYAKKVADAILEESERFVNAYTQQIAREQLRFAEQELERASQRLQQSKAKVVEFQDRHKLLDPAAQAQASSTLITELQSALAKHEAELRNLRSYLQEDSYQVQALRGQIDALRKQLEAERLRSTGSGNSQRLNELAAQFRDLTLQAGFAEDAYKLALSTVENIRIDATRKLKSLVVIEPPTLPEDPLYPRRFYNLATLFIVCCLLYGVTRLVVATIRDHQE